MNSFELIKRLCNTFGPTGCEDAVAELIKREISDDCQNVSTDRMGNLIATMRFGDLNAVKRKKIMVCAHMDEVGFMINEIKSNGYLGIATVGGISDSVLAGRRVSVLSKKGLINGVIASKAIHHKPRKDRKKTTPIDKLYIDIGARDGDQAKEYVGVGDFATFESEFYAFGDGYVKGKALDDRMGCAAMIEMMHRLHAQPAENDVDVYFCFTVREEIGLSGAHAVAFRIRPDLAIVLETTAVADIADTPAAKRVADTGSGAVISVMDKSTMYDRTLVNKAIETANNNGIKAQLKRYVSGGNDAGPIHKTAEGIKTLAISVPTRYLHSPACVAKLDDYETVSMLCEQLIREFKEEI
ncbi:MAG: M42 family metallopeptidase [Ruminococcaceae bacterium]|nr:M42 family metallopeptidase [Oscillospiraceae bacterium]